MSVISRGALEDSPLADLHELASELSIDGYRRLRREALIDAILERQGGEAVAGAPQGGEAGAGAPEAGAGAPEAGEAGEGAEEAPAKPARRRRARSTSAAKAAEEPVAQEDGVTDEEALAGDAAPVADESEDAVADDDDERPARRRRSRRGGRSRSSERTLDPEGEYETEDEAEARRRGGRRGRDEEPRPDAGRDRDEPVREDDEIVEGVVELLPNGSGFVRVDPPGQSDDDVYVSAAQVKRCELVTGDRVSGPRRAPRRSERFASLVRIDTVNDRPASEISDGVRFDELPAEFPRQRIALNAEDPTLKAIEFLTPFGRGSRVTITGPAMSGKSEAIRLIRASLAGQEDLRVSYVLAGARPEEISELSASDAPPAAAVPLGASAEAQAHAVELVVDQARRIAARGADAVVLIDCLDGLEPAAARRTMAAARNLRDGGSLTIIAASSLPIGGETTLITLDGALAAQRRFPALDLRTSGTLRGELLVGEEAAAEIARTVGQAHGA